LKKTAHSLRKRPRRDRAADHAIDDFSGSRAWCHRLGPARRPQEPGTPAIERPLRRATRHEGRAGRLGI